jgi:hypothetical protein
MFHVHLKSGPSVSQSAACYATVGPTITSAISVTIVSASVSAIAVTRTRHQGRLSVMW